ncbi:OLC1v1013243C2 [Oldenlandia corymbosa var. corymbosa]|uniref:Pachytene checkpoint protein 2 homolog n=1 Tax=Oldenlandia corymbosa var. corymbosa TaxID=529605 RepID=A0AAV1E1F7_OLDCO|nr:OLC1v1013243C2 [Oldenlandia corymbosa var. corymbosa]
MSAPMDISAPEQSSAAAIVGEANGAVPQPLPASPFPPPPPVLTDDRLPVSVEVCLKATSTARIEDVRSAVERMLDNRSMSYADGSIPVPLDDPFLFQNVQRIAICDTDEWLENHDVLLFWQVKPVVHVFQLNEEGPCEDLDGDGQLSSFNEWILPAKDFDGMWESLIYEPGLKQRLLRYAASALLFTEKGVDPFLVSWNRYPQCQLVEVNAHSLFSKWFSESGKLVAKLFTKIQEMVEEENNLVFVLIDEVESLAAARKAALSGSEPSDSIRVVNALLTQMDKLRSSPNVIILTTSNITAAIDVAFVDRADIKAYVGPPTLHARYEILRSSFQELLRTGILSDANFKDGREVLIPTFAGAKDVQSEFPALLILSKKLLEAAEACEGLSGRSLRKLPFLAHAALKNPYCCDSHTFLKTLVQTAMRERSEMPD